MELWNYIRNSLFSMNVLFTAKLQWCNSIDPETRRINTILGAQNQKLTDVYGEGVLTVRQCQNWFAKFRSGNFDVEDAPRSGRPVEADKDAIKAFVDANRRITTREIGLRLNLSNSTVYDHLKGLGLSSKLDVWVPHVLTERNLCHCIGVCDSLLNENDPFLKRITGDEKGHAAKKMNRLKPFPKPIFTKKKLNKLNDALQQKRPELINMKGVVFHQDNARPHTSLVTRQKLLQLEWDTMPHPPYSPDLAPSDYYLFRSLQNFLDVKSRITPELPPPRTSIPRQREDFESRQIKLDRPHSIRRVFGGTRARAHDTPATSL
ncbi:histone-lysine N-methyltransferase SETMAR [Trichonephila clavipes]|nr:histone-lysine N-methyltransferase SETMAR [Trichonephila clavipes]